MNKIIIDKTITYLKNLNIIPQNLEINTDLISKLILEEQEEKINNHIPNQNETLEIFNRRYLGSKTKLISFLRNIIDNECGEYNSFFDVFGGTGVVSYSFNTPKVKIIINDLLKSNQIAYQTWLGTGAYDINKIKKYIYNFNNLPKIIEDNYVSINFGNSFFSYENALKIGYIREQIQSLELNNIINEREKAILLTSLLYAMDKVANTCGHYDAFRKKMDSKRKLTLQIPKINNENNFGNEIYNTDSNLLTEHIKADIVYIDPPYNSRQYGDAYHLLENIVTWEKPEVTGVAKKMVNRSNIKSKYCTVAAPTVFKELIDNLDCKYILVSYNNMGEKGAGRSQAKISDIEILEILKSKGEVKVFEQDYQFFTTGKSEISGHKERVFLCKVFTKNNLQKDIKKIINPTIIKSPLNYTGGKSKLLPQIKRFFPSNINTFYDVFTGGANVGINVEANKIICIDKQKILIELYKLFQQIDYPNLEKDIDFIISKYNLSKTSKYGYESYNCCSSKGLAQFNKSGYLQLREDFNNLLQKDNLNKNTLTLFFVLIIYSFNNQIRFNKNKLNIPVGKRDFNNSIRKKLKSFCETVKNKNISFKTQDFREIPLNSLNKNDFFYFDPPYLLATATYNENNGWSEQDELDLYYFIDNLNTLGIKFAFSNVLIHKNKKHFLLENWANSKNYKINFLNFHYNNSNYQKHKTDSESETLEVLITNF